jgi:hypothetical protein
VQVDVSTIKRRLARACTDIAAHGSLPGYSQLPWLTCRRLDVLALVAFIRSGELLRLLLWLTVWELLTHILIWSFDLAAGAAAAPPALACVWVWPWLAAARRRHIDQLLAGRWRS